MGQFAIQGTTALSSFLFVQSMSKEEYGWFTIGTGLLSSLSVLSDAGTGPALQTLAGSAWKEPTRLGPLMLAAQDVRRTLLLVFGTGLAPAFVWLLYRNGAPLAYALVIVTLALFTVWHTTAAFTLAVGCRMHSRYEAVQQAEALAAGTKLGVAFLSLATRLNAAIALLAGSAAAVIQNRRTRLAAASVSSMDGHSDQRAEYRQALRRYLRPLAIPSVFYVLQGQLGIWLVGVMAGVQKVAELGALARFGVLLGVVSSTIAPVAAASFARCDTAPGLTRQLRRFLAGTCLALSPPVIVLCLLPTQALRVLGSDYVQLGTELRLVVIVCVTNTLSALLWALLTARGWVDHAWAVIPATVAAQALALTILDPSTVRGALFLALSHQASTAGVYLFLAMRSLSRGAMTTQGIETTRRGRPDVGPLS